MQRYSPKEVETMNILSKTVRSLVRNSVIFEELMTKCVYHGRLGGEHLCRHLNRSTGECAPFSCALGALPVREWKKLGIKI